MAPEFDPLTQRLRDGPLSVGDPLKIAAMMDGIGAPKAPIAINPAMRVVQRFGIDIGAQHVNRNALIHANHRHRIRLFAGRAPGAPDIDGSWIPRARARAADLGKYGAQRV